MKRSAFSQQQSLAQRLQQGLRLHQQGRLDEAAMHYVAVLGVQRDNFDAVHLFGVARLQQGRHAEAVGHIQSALKLNPESAEAWSNLGVALAGLGQLAEALASYDNALGLKPHYPEALCNRAGALRGLKRPEDALASYARAIALRPDYIEALYNCGLVLKDLAHPEGALACYDRAVALRPGFAEAHNNRGAALQDLKRHAEALASYDRAIAIRPDYAEAHNNRGAALHDLDRREEALASYDRALAILPAYPQAHYNRGNALRGLRRTEEALLSYERALALRPDYAEAANNLGNAWQDLDRHEEALAGYDRALALRPDYAEALNNRGLVLDRLKRPTEALASFEAALARRPDSPEVRLNRGLNALRMGRFAAGWRDYESRFDVKGASKRKLLAPCPSWKGEEVADKRIIVYEEQGLGDIIQMSRFLPLIAARGADVTFLVRASLHRLLRALGPRVRLIDRAPEGESFDLQCALKSLPGVLAVSHQNSPPSAPYLRAEEALASRWADRLGRDGFKIGVCWRGNAMTRTETDRFFAQRFLEPLAAIEGARLISLQQAGDGDRLDDAPPGMRIETPGGEFDAGPDAFVDTAAVMSFLDLVVSADTSIAHLAGALGRAVFVALKHAPDWRWMLDRPDTPWYPTMTLYRQEVRGEWADVFATMAGDVARLNLRNPRGAVAAA
jgi:tetratricopeptide (TPR) repeat protein